MSVLRGSFILTGFSVMLFGAAIKPVEAKVDCLRPLVVNSNHVDEVVAACTKAIKSGNGRQNAIAYRNRAVAYNLRDNYGDSQPGDSQRAYSDLAKSIELEPTAGAYGKRGDPHVLATSTEGQFRPED